MTIIDEICTRIAAIDADRVLICIDGPAGAGKTTLASALEFAIDGAQVIHMDALYNGWDDALSSDLTSRLVTNIRDPHLQGSTVAYRTYDWHAFCFRDYVTVPESRVLIVEGVGAAQAQMRERANLTVYVDIDHDRGRQRVVDRDGADSIDHIDAWQVMEAAHFAADNTAASVHIVIRGDVEF